MHRPPPVPASALPRNAAARLVSLWLLAGLAVGCGDSTAPQRPACRLVEVSAGVIRTFGLTESGHVLYWGPKDFLGTDKMTRATVLEEAQQAKRWDLPGVAAIEGSSDRPCESR